MSIYKNVDDEIKLKDNKYKVIELNIMKIKNHGLVPIGYKIKSGNKELWLNKETFDFIFEYSTDLF